MKIDELIKIAKLENRIIYKILYILLFVFFVFAPGASLLLLEGRIDLFQSHLYIALGIGLLISVPFLLLGCVVYLHPYKTLYEIAYKDITENQWNLLLGIGIWSIISAGATFLLISYFYDWLMLNVSENKFIHYGLVWFIEISVFGTIFYLNSSRIIKS